MKFGKLAILLALASGTALAKDPPKTPAKTAPKAPAKDAKKDAAKPAPPKKQTVVTAENKKALSELYAGFKFGMTKDEVIATLSKSLDEKYEQQLKGTTDVAQQDKLRALKKSEVNQLKSSYIEFKGVKGGWDVSIIEEEFNHNTNEAMLERWEKQGSLNQRRFFFFYEGKLWKMFLSLDVSILPEDKKNFDTFKQSMFAKYGPGDLDVGVISWHTDEFDVRAVDKLKSYDALGLIIEDNRVKKDLYALRESKAPPKKETASIIKAVVDSDGSDHPDVKNTNSNAVDTVIKAQGGSKTPPKK